MTGPMLALVSFVMLLALGWWQRRHVPVDIVVEFRASTTGTRRLEWVTDDGQVRGFVRGDFVELGPRRRW